MLIIPARDALSDVVKVTAVLYTAWPEYKWYKHYQGTQDTHNYKLKIRVKVQQRLDALIVAETRLPVRSPLLEPQRGRTSAGLQPTLEGGPQRS